MISLRVKVKWRRSRAELREQAKWASAFKFTSPKCATIGVKIVQGHNQASGEF
jgi:hypothetical protein